MGGGLWGSWFAWHSEEGAAECPWLLNLGMGVESMVLSVPFSLSKPLHCFSAETLGPQPQLHLGLLQELSVPQRAPLTALQDTWRDNGTVVRRGCPSLG